MIDKALSAIVDGLNRHLEAQFSAAGPLAVLSLATGPDTTAPQSATDRILVTLVNIERESSGRTVAQLQRAQSSSFTPTPSPLNLNLVVLISANFPQKYEDGLSVLSSVVSYFQAHPVLDATNTPSFPPGLERMRVEWKDMDLSAMNSLWAAQGGHYLPSAVYLVRMLTVDGKYRGEDADVITRVSAED